jgi:ribonuclease HI
LAVVTSGKIQKAVVFIDGASRGNPGPASIGAVFKNPKGEIVKTLSLKIGATTNNTAEYMALVLALQEALVLGVDELEVCSDSELLVKQCKGEYKVKEDSLKLLFLIAKQARQGFKNFTVRHVRREGNKLADAAANRALDEELFL